MINFCRFFDLPISGHRQIEFVDVPVNTDVRLFLDPGLIEAGTDAFSQQCSVTIRSYFETVFQNCEARDESKLRELFMHAAEPNETHLGLSVARSQGRGASEEILFTVFSGLIEQGLFERKAVLHPSDVYVLAPNFDKDRMSDLLTNILRNLLSQFTEDQCRKLGVPLMSVRTGYYWDPQKRRWVEGKWRAPMAMGQLIMLVPKSFVSSSYHFTASTYISKYLLAFRKRYHLDNRTELCYEREMKNGKRKLMPPTNKEIKDAEFAGAEWKREAADFAKVNPDTMRLFGIDRAEKFAKGVYFMSDRALDAVLYPDKFRTA